MNGLKNKVSLISGSAGFGRSHCHRLCHERAIPVITDIRLNVLEKVACKLLATDNYKHLFGYVFTDGVKALADNFQCFWFLDIIVSHQSRLKEEEFQVWELIREDDCTVANVVCTEGNDKVLVKQDIPYTKVKPLDATIWGFVAIEFTVIQNTRIYKMSFASAYPLYFQKAKKERIVNKEQALKQHIEKLVDSAQHFSTTFCKTVLRRHLENYHVQTINQTYIQQKCF